MTLNKDYREILLFINSIHDAADFYQKAGLTPADLIESYPELDSLLKGFDDEYVEKLLKNLTWGSACSFICNHNDAYISIFKRSHFDRINREDKFVN